MKKPTPKRQYPPIYEKLVPIALSLLGVIILGVLIFTFAVAFGLF